MDFLLRVIRVLPLADWLALLTFCIGWIGYVRFAKARAQRRPSVLATTNRLRLDWMHEATYRDNRIVDAAVSQSMASSPSFFASTTIFIIGGLIAAIGAGDKTAEMVHDLPFTTPTTTLVLDLKLLVLTGIFVHAFFRFTWSMRQYSFGALLIGATPSSRDFDAAADPLQRRRHAERAGRVLGLAAETFNDGLRAVYLSFAAVLWFLSPLAFVVGTVVVIAVLYRREFHSDVLALLNEPVAPLHPPTP
ncbi:MAG: DUF599 domain-containing protein [Sphaerotilus sp.]|jgi:uncharacterized membrane protein|nr:DUF599 domain-containing protein [Sphaerotilus sp.]